MNRKKRFNFQGYNHPRKGRNKHQIEPATTIKRKRHKNQDSKKHGDNTAATNQPTKKKRKMLELSPAAYKQTTKSQKNQAEQKLPQEKESKIPQATKAP